VWAYPIPGKSTKCQEWLIRKWFINCVFPGFPEVRAIFLRLVSILIKEDLPTLLRPTKAYSGNCVAGHLRASALLTTKEADSISIIYFFTADIADIFMGE